MKSLNGFPKRMHGQALTENVRFFKQQKDDETAVYPDGWLCILSLLPAEDLLREVSGIATDLGAGIIIHVAEIPPPMVVEKYGRTAPFVLRDTGFLRTGCAGSPLHSHDPRRNCHLERI